MTPTVAQMFNRDLTCQSLGIELDDVGPGRACVRLRMSEQMTNGHGIGHGGYLFLLADAAFACASNTHGPVAVAQSAHITYLQPAMAGEELLAEAFERSRQGRFGVYDVTVRRRTGAVIAEFRGNSLLLGGAGAWTHTEE
jgi:acyl-CoA thioesterase